MTRSLPLVLAALLVACATGGVRSATAGQSAARTAAAGERARPLPVGPRVPPEFEGAIRNGTRTATGEPGPRYWQQTARYDLTARLDVEARRLEGTAAIRYVNQSPDTLHALVLELVQNHHREGVTRNQPAEVTGGMVLDRVTAAGVELDSLPTTAAEPPSGPVYQVQGPKLFIAPPTPVAPGASIDLAIDWSFAIAQQGASGRMGWSRDDLFYLAYWYPQMTLYDDVLGWQPDPFLGTAEFYGDFAEYDVRIDVPAGWVVMATGELQNAAEVFRPEVVERLRRAEESDEVVRVLDAADAAQATLGGTGRRLTWHFAADSVHDFAFSVTRRSNWDAARASVGDRDGDGDEDFARVDAFWREAAPRWAQVARYAQHSVSFLSRWTGLPYPWPHMSVIEAADIIDGGMEYPMMTIIGDYNSAGDSALYNVTVHEIAHMWVPMTVANDERRYGWMDEGTTTFNENQARKDFFPGSDPEAGDWEQYTQLAQVGQEGEILRWSDYHYNPAAFTIASYAKPALMLTALRGLLGEEAFTRAYREFIARWAWKHPYPWDLFHTFESMSGRDLDWFWTSWYEERWTLDQAIAGVTRGDGETTIIVEDQGQVPMPARLTIARAGGETQTREVPVETWLGGAATATVTVPVTDVVQVVIDEAHAFPDVDREDNVWVAGE